MGEREREPEEELKKMYVFHQTQKPQASANTQKRISKNERNLFVPLIFTIMIIISFRLKKFLTLSSSHSFSC